jgi:hypothetical protein
MGEGAAPVDVGRQQAAGLGVAGHAHVDDVAGHQVDLGRRTRALDHHHVVLGAQLVERLRDLRPDALAAPAPGQGGERFAHLPHQHDLAVGVALGLEQQRVHAHVGHGVGGQGLEVLGAADFAAVDHAGVVAHVLRLEGRHLQPLPRIPAAQAVASQLLPAPLVVPRTMTHRAGLLFAVELMANCR